MFIYFGKLVLWTLNDTNHLEWFFKILRSIRGHNEVKVKCAEEKTRKFDFHHHYRSDDMKNILKNICILKIHLSSLKNAQNFLSTIFCRFLAVLIVWDSPGMICSLSSLYNDPSYWQWKIQQNSRNQFTDTNLGISERTNMDL